MVTAALAYGHGTKIIYFFSGNHITHIYNMQKLNLHVKLVYGIPLYKLRTIQIFSINTYKYFL